MPVVKAFVQDPFSPTLFNSPPLAVTDEQKNYIRKVLDKSSSDSKFAEKAYAAISLILTGGSVAPPVVTSLSPNTVVLGSPNFDVLVNGSGFTAESVIVFNGFDEPTTLVSPTQVKTGVNMAVWAAPAVVPIMVRSASGVLSNAMNFSFTSSALLSVTQSKQSVEPEKTLKSIEVKTEKK